MFRLRLLLTQQISRPQNRFAHNFFLWMILIRFILSRGLAQGSHMKLKDANVSQGTELGKSLGAKKRKLAPKSSDAIKYSI